MQPLIYLFLSLFLTAWASGLILHCRIGKSFLSVTSMAIGWKWSIFSWVIRTRSVCPETPCFTHRNRYCYGVQPLQKPLQKHRCKHSLVSVFALAVKIKLHRYSRVALQVLTLHSFSRHSSSFLCFLLGYCSWYCPLGASRCDNSKNPRGEGTCSWDLKEENGTEWDPPFKITSLQ